MSERRKARPQPIGDVLSALLSQGELGAGGQLLRLRRAWTAAVGPETAAHARPVAIRDESLVIEVDHAVFSQDLRLREAQVLQALRETAGIQARRLRFAVGGEGVASRDRAPAPPAARAPRRPIATATTRHLAASLDSIQDPELRASARDLVERLARREER